jgi:DnaJ family protein B protein 12
METNKEEAIRCLRIAKNQYGSKNYEAAVRLTKKSINLFSTDEAKEFLAKAEKAAVSTPSTPTTDTPPPSDSQEKSKEREKPSHSQQSSDVREILACGTDYYRVLKVSKKCTEVEIKKSYRKV